MKSYTCDNCKTVTVSKPGVYLKGIQWTLSGILLPDKYCEKHFCNPECFWEWCKKYLTGKETP